MPGIHAFGVKAWMAGTSPAMTDERAQTGICQPRSITIDRLRSIGSRDKA
jgi:hypothetical protein